MIKEIPTVDDLNALANPNFLKENDLSNFGKIPLEKPIRVEPNPNKLPPVTYDPQFGQILSTVKDPKLSKEMADILQEMETDLQSNNAQGAYEKVLKMLNKLENFK